MTQPSSNLSTCNRATGGSPPSNPSQSPIQKSNCLYSGASQKACLAVSSAETKATLVPTIVTKITIARIPRALRPKHENFISRPVFLHDADSNSSNSSSAPLCLSTAKSPQPRRIHARKLRSKQNKFSSLSHSIDCKPPASGKNRSACTPLKSRSRTTPDKPRLDTD